MIENISQNAFVTMWRLLAALSLCAFFALFYVTTHHRLSSSSSKSRHVPKFMLDLYHRNHSDADVVRSIVATLLGKQRYDRYVEYELAFNLPALEHNERLTNATLKIRIVGNNATDFQQAIEVAIDDDKYIADEYHDTWLSFDVSGALQRLSASNVTTANVICRTRLGLSIKDERHNPLLLLSYKLIENPSSRRKRRSIVEDENHLWRKMRNTCRRRSLHVDFATIRYDEWIVQPRSYDAYQCQGRCIYPLPDHLSPTRHAIVQTLVHSVAPSMVARTCCVPTKLSPISILYVDARGVLTYRYAYADMAVSECGCR